MSLVRRDITILGIIQHFLLSLFLGAGAGLIATIVGATIFNPTELEVGEYIIQLVPAMIVMAIFAAFGLVLTAIPRLLYQSIVAVIFVFWFAAMFSGQIWVMALYAFALAFGAIAALTISVAMMRMVFRG